MTNINDSTCKNPLWKIQCDRFVVFLDILGFKEMILRENPENIYQLLKTLSFETDEIEKEADNLKYLFYSHSLTSIKTFKFSDSIIIFSNDLSLNNFLSITTLTSKLFAKLIHNGIPIKGAFSCGKIIIDLERDIYFGQPIIDSHQLQEEVNYFGVVVHNSVEKLIVEEKWEVDSLFIDKKTPLKNGSISHRNLNWFEFLKYMNRETFDLTHYEASKLYLDKIKLTSSGSTRKYFENTLEFISDLNFEKK
jgi:hypothetical protein